MNSLEALIQTLQKEQRSVPLERWIDRTKELRTALLKKIFSLSRYVDELPAHVNCQYARLLIDVLTSVDPELWDSYDQEVYKLSKTLEDSGQQTIAGLLEKTFTRERC